MNDNPLGKDTRYPNSYSPDLLFAISRKENRAEYMVDGDLIFQGVDIWNAWEFSWLDDSGRPHIGKLTILFSANSENIVESKSLKLYLNTFSNNQFQSPSIATDLIKHDLSQLTNSDVKVLISSTKDNEKNQINSNEGHSIDQENANFTHSKVTTEALKTENDIHTEELLYSEILRTNCPVTNQPDTGTIIIKYKGKKIYRGGLLSYINSYRGHNDFHEACVEKIFMDIKKLCQTNQLTVYARYNRRGGIDINPFRSDFENNPENIRLWRQ
ncbi:MAG: 7-cyano-7-deazaguanine reductase [Woeseiaceae bacterium]